MNAVFVAGAHTDVGKTHVACALIEAARAGGRSVEALKPVVSGFDPADWGGSDPGRLLAALGRAPTEAALAAISPWRFVAPLAPPMAARREGRALVLAGIAAFCRRRLAEVSADFALVEGVGGLMSPIADDATGLELMTALGLPAILVGGSYLGAISHTLTALDSARGRGLAVQAVVVSQSAEREAPDFAETMADVRRFAAGVPVIGAPRTGAADGWAAATLALLRA
ncbi:MAG: dethiobiotin synthase [Phenylobacterium sp.]|uniref:dethiobiotin synthase n=1 Tax=Phenylobacterium sp. TaxID=1871053 RepID=UPI001205A927|nr:dethiobiotin synthase [Phenylobacterium sp.]TAJ68990.1 MAG: dethiobiotin synthase [Phenylobacterium sp.]